MTTQHAHCREVDDHCVTPIHSSHWKGLSSVCTVFVVILWSHALVDSLAVAERSFFILSNYRSAWLGQRPLCQSAVNSHNGTAQQRTMSQIPQCSPQVQRLSGPIKKAELQCLCYSTPSSFPTDHPSGDIGSCLCVPMCVRAWQGGLSSQWEHWERLKYGRVEKEGACFLFLVGGERLFTLF